MKIKVDPTKVSLDEMTTKQLEDIADGWMKFLTKAFRDAKEKVMSNDGCIEFVVFSLKCLM